jgi:tetratricopeptide (TPR) repeat protein
VITTLEEALAINQTHEQPHAVLAAILIGLGQTHRALGDHDRAHACLQQALEVGRSYGNGEWEGAALHNLAAAIASATGSHDHAGELYDQAVAVFHRAGDRYQEATALIDSGHAFTRSARPGKAYQRWQQARTIAEQTGNPRITAIDAFLDGLRFPVASLFWHPVLAWATVTWCPPTARRESPHVAPWRSSWQRVSR